MARPSIKTPCVADTYAGPNERYAEVSSGAGDGKGCLISVTRLDDGRLLVDVYRISAGVEVRVGEPERS